MRIVVAFLTVALAVSYVACTSGTVGAPGIATIVDRTTHRASSADEGGGNRDSVGSFAPGTTHVLLDTDGPGCITHIWMTLAVFPGNLTFPRDLILRMYWERSPLPSVEVPVGDFFALGHCRRYPVQSAMVAVGQHASAWNCYWPMPFHRHARVEIHNAGSRSIRWLFYHVDYERGPIPQDQGLFHAAFRRAKALRSQAWEGNTTGADNYVILDTRGEGQYVGCVLSVDAEPGGWWGEGDDMIFVDGNDLPSMRGTGSEDYFCNAWGFQSAFCYPYYGAPLLEDRPDGGVLTTVYRWHVADPIRFRRSIRVTIERIFKGEVANDYASVAYWYQRHPIEAREPLPPAAENYPRHMPSAATRPVTPEREATELEPVLRDRGVEARAISASLHDGYRRGGWLRIEAPSGRVEVPVPVPAEGQYRLSIKPVNHVVTGSLRITARGGPTVTYEKRTGREHDVPHLDLGRVFSEDKVIVITIEGGPVVGIDCFRVEPVGTPGT